jgi:hypothetical protein
MKCDVAVVQIQGLFNFLRKCRETGFFSAKIAAIEIASAFDVETMWRMMVCETQKKWECGKEFTPESF